MCTHTCKCMCVSAHIHIHIVLCFKYSTTDGNCHPSTWGRDANTNNCRSFKLNACKICPLISICSCCYQKGLSLLAGRLCFKEQSLLWLQARLVCQLLSLSLPSAGLFYCRAFCILRTPWPLLPCLSDHCWGDLQGGLLFLQGHRMVASLAGLVMFQPFALCDLALIWGMAPGNRWKIISNRREGCIQARFHLGRLFRRIFSLGWSSDPYLPLQPHRRVLIQCCIAITQKLLEMQIQPPPVELDPWRSWSMESIFGSSLNGWDERHTL